MKSKTDFIFCTTELGKVKITLIFRRKFSPNKLKFTNQIKVALLLVDGVAAFLRDLQTSMITKP